MSLSIPASPRDFFYQRGRGTGAGSSSDQQIRFVVRYGGLLDRALLHRAVRALVDEEPILRARLLEPHPFEGRWEVRDGDSAVPACELQEVAAVEQEGATTAFLTGTEVRDEGPYFRVRVIRAAGRDTLCLRVDHRLCDGGGTKLLAYRLSETYRRLAAGDPSPVVRRELLPRSVAEITKREPPPLADATFPPERSLSYSLPRRGFVNEEPAYAVRVLDAAAVAAVLRTTKPLGATLTDAMLAALLRALRPHRMSAAGERLTLMVSADCRSRLPAGTPELFCNLFHGLFPELRDDPTQSFQATLVEVAAALGRCRAALTLDAALQAEVLFARNFQRWAHPPRVSASRAEREATFIVFSNVGVIDASRLELGPAASPVLDAQLLGTVALGRELLLCASTFRGALTLSIGYCRSDLDAAVLEGVLDRVAAELTSSAQS